MLIGRDNEKVELETAIESDKSEFIAVYGRRRARQDGMKHSFAVIAKPYFQWSRRKTKVYSARKISCGCSTSKRKICIINPIKGRQHQS